MKVTIDTLTGKPFRYNGTVAVDGYLVPARHTSRTAEHLHPDRVRAAILAKLNPGKPPYVANKPTE